jgi:hypothetical protein
LVSAEAEFARKGIAAASKLSKSNLRYLASYARFAIRIGKFSPKVE